jgi:hypothetical protein
MTTFARPYGMRLSSPDAYRATTSSMLAQDKATVERLNQQFTTASSKVDFRAVHDGVLSRRLLRYWARDAVIVADGMRGIQNGQCARALTEF